MKTILFWTTYYLNAFYRPQTELWEGNVFTRVCQSVHRGEVDPTLRTLPSGQYTPDPQDHTLWHQTSPGNSNV